jgi:hypothetical protein
MGALGLEWIAERGGPKGLTRTCLQRRTSSGTWAASLNHFRGSWMGAAARSFTMRCDGVAAARCTLHTARLAAWLHSVNALSGERGWDLATPASHTVAPPQSVSRAALSPGAVLRQRRRRPYLWPVRHPILDAIANQAGQAAHPGHAAHPGRSLPPASSFIMVRCT